MPQGDNFELHVSLSVLIDLPKIRTSGGKLSASVLFFHQIAPTEQGLCMSNTVSRQLQGYKPMTHPTTRLIMRCDFAVRRRVPARLRE